MCLTDTLKSTLSLTKERQYKDYHLFNLLAYKNRVGANQLSDEVPSDPMDTPLSSFLPSDDDNKHYLQEFTHITAWVWCRQIPALRWWEKHLPSHLSHEHEGEMKRKTERVKCLVMLYAYSILPI